MPVDTSVWIDCFNGHRSPEVNRLTQVMADGEPLAITGLIWTEILSGFRTDAEANPISGLLDAFDYVKEPIRTDYIEAARIYRVCRPRALPFVRRSTG